MSRPTTVTFLLCLLFCLSITKQANVEIDNNGEIVKQQQQLQHSQCGLYMAPSAIPNAGWGMYTGKPLQKGEIIAPTDVAIVFSDYYKQMKKKKEYNLIPNDFASWLLEEYYWSPTVTRSTFDAASVATIIPGFGMLANSHPGLVNLENGGCKERVDVNRTSNPLVGSFSECQNMSFITRNEVPAGHELFVEYGDEWFSGRVGFEGVPLSTDYKSIKRLAIKYKKLVSTAQLDETMQNDVLDMINSSISLFPPRKQVLLPTMIQILQNDKSANVTYADLAYTTVPEAIRSIEWLDEYGLCLDNIQPRISSIPDAGYGAVARRNLKSGSVVSPAPVVHLSQKHMDTIWTASSEEEGGIMWSGEQLLQNYVYSHPSTSLRFFPYSPAVNLINHGSNNANVALRWNMALSDVEMFNKTADELVKSNRKSSLVMEIYALRDILEGEEILLDYGSDWEYELQQHIDDWTPPLYADDEYVPAQVYNRMTDIPTRDTLSIGRWPTHLIARCWVDKDQVEQLSTGKKKAYTVPYKATSTSDIDESVECTILRRYSGENNTYSIRVEDSIAGDKNIEIDNMPREAIIFVDAEYTGNQFLRGAFRHSIQLPDDMIPVSWNDMEYTPGDDQCGLYMAESSIPHSGLGMYTMKSWTQSQQIFSGDVVIQAEDVEVNKKLRHWYHDSDAVAEEPGWLLENYFWNPSLTLGLGVASQLESVVPGLGMLANSHTGLVNADIAPPGRTTYLKRRYDAGTGASTDFHNVRFYASQDIVPGSELFVEYGDNWFSERADLGSVPLSKDFVAADNLLTKFDELIDAYADATVGESLWSLVMYITEWKPRLYSALPKSFAEVKSVIEIGTAAQSVPNRIRSKEWLDENGLCLDNIKPSKSNYRQAGLGAFATRHISTRQVIAPMPMVHLNRRHMEVYDSDDIDDPESPIEKSGLQLLLNYCYGHPNSTLLLFPYSPVINYVNHNATLANAELRWSRMPNHHSEWMERSPRDLDKEDHAGLIMELVATRDISPGEEIYLDYGVSWEQSWQEHLHLWEGGFEDYKRISANELNERVEWLRTINELEEHPYPTTDIELMCFIGQKWKNQQVHDSKQKGKKLYDWQYSTGIYDSSQGAYPCDVIGRELGSNKRFRSRVESVSPLDTHYTIQFNNKLESGTDKIMRGVPRRAIQFVDWEYKSDMTLRSAFRHEIHIPDDIFPKAWMDL